MGANATNNVLPVAAVQANMGKESGRQKTQVGEGAKDTEIPPFTTALKARILDSLAKVKGNSFAAFCIKLFVKNAHIKTDYEVKQMVKGLQSQINDNPAVLMRVLGNQYDFIRSVKWSEAFA